MMNSLYWGGKEYSKEGKFEVLYSNIDSDDLYRERNEIWFSCCVSQKSINKLIKLIYEAIHDDKLSAYKDAEDFFEVIIHIDSYGGHPGSAFKFIDFVEQLKKKKIKFRTIINGRACSAATLMAIVGNKKQITKHSYAMIHELQAVSGGYHTHIRSYQNYLNELQQQIVDTYNTYKNKTNDEEEKVNIDQIERWMAGETWFNAKSYLDIGFIDEII